MEAADGGGFARSTELGLCLNLVLGPVALMTRSPVRVLAVGEMNAELVSNCLDGFDAAGVDLEMAGELRGGQLRVGFRADAMAEDVPAGGVAFGEFESLFEGETLTRCAGQWRRVFCRR